MTGNRSNAASMPAAVRGSGGQMARLITFEKESSGDRRALRNRSYASRSMVIVFVAIHVCVHVCVFGRQAPRFVTHTTGLNGNHVLTDAQYDRGTWKE